MPISPGSHFEGPSRGRGVGVFNLKLTNSLSKVRPTPEAVLVESAGGLSYNFMIAGESNESAENASTTLVSFELPPGDYTLSSITGNFHSFPFSSRFSQNPKKRFSITEGRVAYLGTLDGVLKSRTSTDEASAGALGGTLMLVDDNIMGVSGGTFKWQVSDAYETDVPQMKARVPGLASSEVLKQVLE